MNYRTKATIEDGIVRRWELGDARSNVDLIDYQPGNGTRYVLCFTLISDTSAADYVEPGAQRVYVVSWLHRGGSLLVARGSFLDWERVAKEFKVSKEDAVVLAEVIGYATGVRATTSEEARRQDGAGSAPSAN